MRLVCSCHFMSFCRSAVLRMHNLLAFRTLSLSQARRKCRTVCRFTVICHLGAKERVMQAILGVNLARQCAFVRQHSYTLLQRNPELHSAIPRRLVLLGLCIRELTRVVPAGSADAATNASPSRSRFCSGFDTDAVARCMKHRRRTSC